MACHSSKLEIHNSNICSFMINPLLSCSPSSTPIYPIPPPLVLVILNLFLLIFRLKKGSPRDPARSDSTRLVRPCDLPHRASKAPPSIAGLLWTVYTIDLLGNFRWLCGNRTQRGRVIIWADFREEGARKLDPILYESRIEFDMNMNWVWLILHDANRRRVGWTTG
jgi:hypothetical protein